MLGKLIKHEFRATGRLMAPLFGAMLLLAVFVRVSDLILSAADVPVFFEALNSLLLIVYVLAILSVTVFSTVLMIKRFHQNFLTDEGYLMFTLPTSVHSLLWSKLITAALFFIFTFLADALAVAIVVWRGVDQLMIDVTDIPEAKMGDEVIVVGTDGDKHFTFDDMAAILGTINYELPCVLTKRVPRVYKENGEIVGIVDHVLHQYR